MGGSRALAQGWPLIAGGPPPTLGVLTISPNTTAVGQAFSGTISGATIGSSIVLDSLTISGSGTTRVVTGTITGAPGSWSATETLAGAVGSPRTTQNALTVVAAGSANLPIWTAAKSAVTAGTRNARILMVGHSGPAGQGATGNSQSDNAHNGAYGFLLSRLRNGGSSNDIGNQSFFGNNRADGGAATVNAWNNMLTQGSWAKYNSNSGATLGGSLFTANAATATPLSFVTTASGDGIEIFYVSTASAASFSVSIDGGAAQTITVPAGAAYRSTKITGLANTTHTYAFNWVSGTVYLHGANQTRSAQRAVDVLNVGACSMLTADVLSNVTGNNFIAALNYLAADLTVLHLAGNDILQQTSTTAFDTNTRKYTTAIKNAGSDLIMVTDIPLNGFQTSRAPYDNIIKQIASDVGATLVDFNALWGNDWAAADARGWYGPNHDNYHAGPLGQAANAGYINAVL